MKFRFSKKDGGYTTVLDHGRIVESANCGRVFYVLVTDAQFLTEHYAEKTDE